MFDYKLFEVRKYIVDNYSKNKIFLPYEKFKIDNKQFAVYVFRNPFFEENIIVNDYEFSLKSNNVYNFLSNGPSGTDLIYTIKQNDLFLSKEIEKRDADDFWVGNEEEKEKKNEEDKKHMLHLPKNYLENFIDKNRSLNLKYFEFNTIEKS
ncbi:MAG: hypothetical protein HRT67_13325 [Flavobacteriaceae bacterium]|nr:hypothetical protein [Flavobacteriaceae bacterium]